jgi:hypothetical protein
MRVIAVAVPASHPLAQQGRGLADAMGLPQSFVELIERCAEIGAWDTSCPVAAVPATSVEMKGKRHMTSIHGPGMNPLGTPTPLASGLKPLKKGFAGFDSSGSGRKVGRAMEPVPLAPEAINGGPIPARAQPVGVATTLGNKDVEKPATRGRRVPSAIKDLRLNRTGDAIVVTFDMCSSSRILERLTLNADLPRFHNFLTKLKQYLAAQQQKFHSIPTSSPAMAGYCCSRRIPEASCC